MAGQLSGIGLWDSKGKVTTYKYISKYIAILLCTRKPGRLA